MAYTGPSLSGRTPEQKKILKKFFFPSGCLGALTKMKPDAYSEIVRNAIKPYGRAAALKKLGVDEEEVKEVQEIELGDANFEKNEVWCRRGNLYFSDAYTRTFIFGTDKQILVYSVTVSTVNNNVNVRTEEIFYKDVTKIVVDSDTIEKIKQTKDYLCISVMGEKLKFFIAHEAVDSVENSLSGIKAKIREAKA